MKPESWLKKEDNNNKIERIGRLQFLAEITPENKIWLFHGGFLVKALFEEARYSFVYGQFLASIILGLSFIEKTLASQLFGSGNDEYKDAPLIKIMKGALEKGWINIEEYQQIESAKSIRNRVVHFREPIDRDSIEYIVLDRNKFPYRIIEEEARYILNISFNILSKFSC